MRVLLFLCIGNGFGDDFYVGVDIVFEEWVDIVNIFLCCINLFLIYRMSWYSEY